MKLLKYLIYCIIPVISATGIIAYSAYEDEIKPKTCSYNFTTEELIIAQIALNKLGYYSGKIDGNTGLNFRYAIFKFAEDYKYKVQDFMTLEIYNDLKPIAKNDDLPIIIKKGSK